MFLEAPTVVENEQRGPIREWACGTENEREREREGGREGGRGRVYVVVCMCGCVYVCVWIQRNERSKDKKKINYRNRLSFCTLACVSECACVLSSKFCVVQGKEWKRNFEECQKLRSRSMGEIVHCFVKNTFIYICDNGRGWRELTREEKELQAREKRLENERKSEIYYVLD